MGSHSLHSEVISQDSQQITVSKAWKLKTKMSEVFKPEPVYWLQIWIAKGQEVTKRKNCTVQRYLNNKTNRQTNKWTKWSGGVTRHTFRRTEWSEAVLAVREAAAGHQWGGGPGSHLWFSCGRTRAWNTQWDWPQHNKKRKNTLQRTTSV